MCVCVCVYIYMCLIHVMHRLNLSMFIYGIQNLLILVYISYTYDSEALIHEWMMDCCCCMRYSMEVTELAKTCIKDGHALIHK
jgi:hypothetical protein